MNDRDYEFRGGPCDGKVVALPADIAVGETTQWVPGGVEAWGDPDYKGDYAVHFYRLVQSDGGDLFFKYTGRSGR